MQPKLERLPAVAPIDRTQEAALRLLIDGKAKPPGSLGRLEELALSLALIRRTAAPRVDRVALLLFAGDHGLTEEGVSRYPAAVTAAMVRTTLAGRAAVNALARAVGAEVTVIDAGVAAELPAHRDLRLEKIRRGTRNAAHEPALQPDEAFDALVRGARIADEAVEAGADIVTLGDLGIGNTSSAALLMHRLAPAPLEQCVGLGAGQDAEGLARKRAALERAAARSPATAPFDVLCEFGGLEIAMMAGAIIGAASRSRPVLIDGFIAGAAALVAIGLRAAARDYCIFAHRSAEAGHGLMLARMDAEPLLDLGLRLGEGTGALLAVPLLRAAALMLTEMASLEEVLAGGV